ncbi:NUDIX hydrolase [bacterium]|nr:NUDIX hydrolase [bacterium]
MSEAREGGRRGLIPSASVLLLRDGPDGVETFVVVRHRRSSSFAGMLVFPGGQVDDADAAPDLLARCSDLDPEQAARRLAGRLSPPDRALAQYVGGLRELFEEAGVLLARKDGDWLAPGRGVPSLEEMRHSLHEGSTDLLALSREHGFELAPGALSFFAHWITPEQVATRFDTRFFVATLPPGQEARHDGRETSSGEWLRPAEALARYRRGEAQLVPPTFVLLSELARLPDAASAHAAAVAREVTTILPRWFGAPDGSTAFLYPGDVAYEGGEVDRPGPRRRLVVRDGLFEEVVAD